MRKLTAIPFVSVFRYARRLDEQGPGDDAYRRTAIIDTHFLVHANPCSIARRPRPLDNHFRDHSRTISHPQPFHDRYSRRRTDSDVRQDHHSHAHASPQPTSAS